MIDEEYAEIKRIQNGELFYKKFDKRFMVDLEIWRTYIDPNSYGFSNKNRYYKIMKRPDGKPFRGVLIPQRTNISTKTGLTEVERTNGTRLEVLNEILITDLLLLNNESSKSYIDLIKIDQKFCRPVITQVYYTVLPHIEYQLETYLQPKDVVLVKEG